MCFSWQLICVSHVPPTDAGCTNSKCQELDLRGRQRKQGRGGRGGKEKKRKERARFESNLHLRDHYVFPAPLASTFPVDSILQLTTSLACCVTRHGLMESLCGAYWQLDCRQDTLTFALPKATLGTEDRLLYLIASVEPSPPQANCLLVDLHGS